MTALPRVLGIDDLPLPELAAARLDGELFPVARGWLAADTPATEADRAAAAALGLPAPWVAASMTAAWIWGAADAAPDPAVFYVTGADRGAKQRPGVTLREVPLQRADWTSVGGTRVATVARTLGDVLRGLDWDDARAFIALRLAERLADGRDHLDRGRLARLPNGTAALRRLDDLTRLDDLSRPENLGGPVELSPR